VRAHLVMEPHQANGPSCMRMFSRPVASNALTVRRRRCCCCCCCCPSFALPRPSSGSVGEVRRRAATSAARRSSLDVLRFAGCCLPRALPADGGGGCSLDGGGCRFFLGDSAWLNERHRR
jgi:hypothetical protein